MRGDGIATPSGAGLGSGATLRRFSEANRLMSEHAACQLASARCASRFKEQRNERSGLPQGSGNGVAKAMWRESERRDETTLLSRRRRARTGTSERPGQSKHRQRSALTASVLWYGQQEQGKHALPYPFSARDARRL